MVLRILAIFSISMLLAAQSYNLMRGAGDSAFSFFISLGVVLGLFVTEALLTAVMTQRSNPFKEMAMISILLCLCAWGEYMVYQAGHVAMAIGGYKQIDSELENTYEMRLLNEQKNNALWNSHNCGKSDACDNHESLDNRADAITDKMTALRDESIETPTQAAMKATGNDVASVAGNFAALIQLISIVLAGAIGIVWGTDIPDSRSKKAAGSSRAPISKTAAEDKRIAREHKDDKAETKQEKVRAKLAASRSQRSSVSPKTRPGVPSTVLPPKGAETPDSGFRKAISTVAQRSSYDRPTTAKEHAKQVMLDLPAGKVYSYKTGAPITGELSSRDLVQYAKPSKTQQKIMDELERQGVVKKRANRAALVSSSYQYTLEPKTPGMVRSGESYVRKKVQAQA